MGPRLIFDHSAIAKNLWFRILSPGYESHTGSEPGDFGYEVACFYYEMVLRFNPCEIIFALDSKPYWRNFYYAHEYGSNSMRIYMHKGEADHFLLDMDKAIYQVKRHDMTGNWEVNKFTINKAQEAGLNWECQTEEESDFKLIQLSDITDQQAKDAVTGQIPAYKGSRSKAHWKAKTPKEEFNRLLRNIAYTFAPLVGGKVVEVDFAEADDIIHEYTKMEPGNNTILVSFDMDLQQCCKNGMFVHYWNFQKKEWVECNTMDVWYKLFCKVIGGDSSDNVKGCSFVKRAGALPEVKFKNGVVDAGKGTAKFIDDCLKQWCVKNNCDKATPEAFNYVYEMAEKKQDRNTFTRNYNLVNMDRKPDAISQAIREKLQSVKAQVPEVTLEDYGITQTEAGLIQRNALADRQSDEADGVFEL